MHLSWFADVAGLISFVLGLPGYWALFSEKGRAVMLNRKWVPTLLLTLGITIAGLHLLLLLGLIGPFSSLANPRLSFETTEKISIRNRSYLNETVKLDGIDYINCTFENVTLEYDGLAPFNIITPTIKGSMFKFHTNNQSIAQLIGLFRALGWIPKGAEFSNGPERDPVP